MTRKCIVPNCKTGYLSETKKFASLGLKTPSLFSIPKESLALWSEQIAHPDRPLTSKDTVCAKHFVKGDVITHDEFVLPGGYVERIQRKIAILKKGAVPVIFPERKQLDDTKDFSVKMPSTPRRSRRKIDHRIHKRMIKDDTTEEEEEEEEIEIKQESDDISYDQSDNLSEVEGFNVEQLHEIAPTIDLPGSMWGVHRRPGGKTAFVHINEDMVIDKTVEFTDSCVPEVKVNGSLIELPEVRNKTHLECLLRGIDAIGQQDKKSAQAVDEKRVTRKRGLTEKEDEEEVEQPKKSKAASNVKIETKDKKSKEIKKNDNVKKTKDENVKKTKDDNVKKAKYENVKKMKDANMKKTKDENVKKTKDETVKKAKDANVKKTKDETVKKTKDANVKKTKVENVRKTKDAIKGEVKKTKGKRVEESSSESDDESDSESDDESDSERDDESDSDSESTSTTRTLRPREAKQTPKPETRRMAESRRQETPKPETRRMAEARKQETPKPETRKSETTKVDTRKSEATKPENRKSETSKGENRKLETPKPETRKPETPKPETRKPETLKTEAPKTETPTLETPKLIKTKQRRKTEEIFSLGTAGTGCIVETCTNNLIDTRRDGLNISYYRFPTDDKLLKKWMEKCKVDSSRSIKSARVCSEHFRLEDFDGAVTPGTSAAKRNLKPKAVPSLFLSKKKVHEPEPKPEPKAKPVEKQKSTTNIENKENIRKTQDSGKKVQDNKRKSIENVNDKENSNNSIKDSSKQSKRKENLSEYQSGNKDQVLKEKSRTRRDDSPEPQDPIVFEEDSPVTIVPHEIETIEILDSESSEESDAYDEVIQVKIVAASATSSEESDADQSVKRRRRCLKRRRKKPTLEENGDYEIETLEIVLGSNDEESDAEVVALKKSINSHLGVTKTVTFQDTNLVNGNIQVPIVKRSATGPVITQIDRSKLTPVDANVVKAKLNAAANNMRSNLKTSPTSNQGKKELVKILPYSPQKNHNNIDPRDSPTRDSQGSISEGVETNIEPITETPQKKSPIKNSSLSTLLLLKDKIPDRDTIIKIVEQKISENYKILNTKPDLTRSRAEYKKSIDDQQLAKRNKMTPSVPKENVIATEKKQMPRKVPIPIFKSGAQDMKIPPKPAPVSSVAPKLQGSTEGSMVKSNTKPAEKVNVASSENPSKDPVRKLDGASLSPIKKPITQITSKENVTVAKSGNFEKVGIPKQSVQNKKELTISRVGQNVLENKTITIQPPKSTQSVNLNKNVTITSVPSSKTRIVEKNVSQSKPTVTKPSPEIRNFNILEKALARSDIPRARASIYADKTVKPLQTEPMKSVDILKSATMQNLSQQLPKQNIPTKNNIKEDISKEKVLTPPQLPIKEIKSENIVTKQEENETMEYQQQMEYEEEGETNMIEFVSADDIIIEGTLDEINEHSYQKSDPKLEEEEHYTFSPMGELDEESHILIVCKDGEESQFIDEAEAQILLRSGTEQELENRLKEHGYSVDDGTEDVNFVEVQRQQFPQNRKPILLKPKTEKSIQNVTVVQNSNTIKEEIETKDIVAMQIKNAGFREIPVSDTNVMCSVAESKSTHSTPLTKNQPKINKRIVVSSSNNQRMVKPKLKIPAQQRPVIAEEITTEVIDEQQKDESFDEAKVGKALLDTLFLGNNSSENIFDQNEEIVKQAEIQEILGMVQVQQAGHDDANAYTPKVIVVNNIDGAEEAQWDYETAVVEQKGGTQGEYYCIAQEDVGHTSETVKEQSFDENEYLSMECFEVEIINNSDPSQSAQS